MADSGIKLTFKKHTSLAITPRSHDIIKLILLFYNFEFYQGTLTEGEGSVQLTSSLGSKFYKKSLMLVISKAADLNKLVQGGQLY